MPTIALVDDDPNILTSLSIALEAEGYQVVTYADGFLALQSFQSSPPDLAILDIKMPHTRPVPPAPDTPTNAIP